MKTSRFVLYFYADVYIPGYIPSFLFFDRDEKGYITFNDFYIALKQIQGGVSPTNTQVKALIKDYDINGDGRVTFEEFVIVMVKRVFGYVVDRKGSLKELFRRFDHDDSGTLGGEELEELLAELDHVVSEDDREALLEEYAERRLQYSEFVDLMSAMTEITADQ